MRWMHGYREKILKDCLDLLSVYAHDTQARAKFLKLTAEQRYKFRGYDLAEELYSRYAAQSRLGMDVKRFEGMCLRMNTELHKAQALVLSKERKPGLQVQEDAAEGWVYCYVNPKHRRSSAYRVYLDIAVPLFSHFIEDFLERLFKQQFHCPHCGSPSAGLDGSSEIVCATCGYREFVFSFKFLLSHGPMEAYQPFLDAGLRRDKVILYFGDKYTLYAVIKLLEHMPREYFANATMPFCHTVFPGVAFVKNPGERETAIYRKITQKLATKISLGQYITSLLARSILKIVEEYGETWTALSDERKLTHIRERLVHELLANPEFEELATDIESVLVIG
ncbi:hypothetical protein J4419_00175 [Candidatus Woesearchaeota archaeon]|nr:hypothetical protein [Candidatus Woesearchaeota archaeon]